MCNVRYTLSEDGSVSYGYLPDGIVFNRCERFVDLINLRIVY